MKITNELGLPQPFVDAVSREYQYKDKQYSVTSLLKGTMQSILERRYADVIEQDVSDMVWMIFGTAVHSILEHSKESENQLKENWLCIDIGEYKLSGIFDLYDAKLKRVSDYKTGSVWKVQFNDWEDYRKQLLIYAYMLRSIGFECDNGEIVMLLKDHSKTKANIDASYPQHNVHIQHFDFSQKDFNDVEEFIYKKFAEIKLNENRADEELTPCTEEERWEEPTKYAVKKKGNKRAIRVYESLEEAQTHIESEKGLELEVRKGTCKRCQDYCSVKDYCWFYRKKYGKDETV